MWQDTLSPIIMEVDLFSLNERKRILEMHPCSTSMIMGGMVITLDHLASGFTTAYSISKGCEQELALLGGI